MGSNNYLRIHPADNVLVALKDLPAGKMIAADKDPFELKEPIKAKHKIAAKDLLEGNDIILYGVLVGRAVEPIPKGGLLTTKNIVHASSGFSVQARNIDWEKPDTSKFANRTFLGYHRADGKVGTANYWLVIPMVFCENRNVTILKEALVEKLGYTRKSIYQEKTAVLVELYQRGAAMDAILQADINTQNISGQINPRLFENIDGIKFLTHDMGCGGTRSDSNALCGLLAGYIAHANVAGATVLSLGCQHAQADILKEEVEKRLGAFQKPLLIFEQQIEGTEEQLVNEALKQTFVGLIEANRQNRAPASLDKLCIGLECGGSDGFSGISANPAIGYTSDLLVALGGSVILSEFPELCGVEQDLSDRCLDETKAEKFIHLMKTYNALAEAGGSGFYANPSPGNIKDGLITDAIKSAGAAKKGGSSPVVDVLDYPEFVTKPGLNLLCTPGSDVESTTAEVGAGANVVLFTTGLGTPTGNPISPVIKLSTNTALAEKMPDIIDINCGTIIDGKETIEQAGERVLNFVIEVASGHIKPKSVELEQDDFIPWKRGVSL